MLPLHVWFSVLLLAIGSVLSPVDATRLQPHLAVTAAFNDCVKGPNLKLNEGKIK